MTQGPSPRRWPRAPWRSLLGAWLPLARLIGRTTRPIRELSALTEQVAARREYGARATVAGDDELATLASGFNQMLATIQQRDAELEAHRASLATEVEARTADLAQATAPAPRRYRPPGRGQRRSPASSWHSVASRCSAPSPWRWRRSPGA